MPVTQSQAGYGTVLAPPVISCDCVHTSDSETNARTGVLIAMRFNGQHTEGMYTEGIKHTDRRGDVDRSRTEGDFMRAAYADTKRRLNSILPQMKEPPLKPTMVTVSETRGSGCHSVG